MTHPDGLPDDAPEHARRMSHGVEDYTPALMREPRGKPSNWWAFEREPWKRINAEIVAKEKAGADGERADRALRNAFAFAGAALAMAHAPALVPGDRFAMNQART
jgi:hypothetical protein